MSYFDRYSHFSDVSDEVEQLNAYYSEDGSVMSVITLHMAELLHSYVRGDSDLERQRHVRELSKVRDGISTGVVGGDLKVIANFSVILEEGLKCMATKCAIMENALAKMPPDHNNALNVATNKEISEELPRKKLHVQCDMCKCTVVRAHFANHLRFRHSEEFAKIARYRCEHCKVAKYIKPESYLKHIQLCRVRMEEERELKRRMPSASQLICRLCEATFITLKELLEHGEKEHPLCKMLACSGCGMLYRHDTEIIEHWREAKHKFVRTRCGSDAHATLISRPKLVAQMLAAAKNSGALKNSPYVECMFQPVRCLECGATSMGFAKLYNHVYQRHNRMAKNSLEFGCLGCGTRYKCPPSLREHLLKREIEKDESCKNAGVVYWNEVMISTDGTEENNEEDSDEEETGNMFNTVYQHFWKSSPADGGRAIDTKNGKMDDIPALVVDIPVKATPDNVEEEGSNGKVEKMSSTIV